MTPKQRRVILAIHNLSLFHNQVTATMVTNRLGYVLCARITDVCTDLVEQGYILRTNHHRSLCTLKLTPSGKALAIALRANAVTFEKSQPADNQVPIYEAPYRAGRSLSEEQIAALYKGQRYEDVKTYDRGGFVPSRSAQGLCGSAAAQCLGT